MIDAKGPGPDPTPTDPAPTVGEPEPAPLNFKHPQGQFLMCYQECEGAPITALRQIPAARIQELFTKAIESRNLMRDGVHENNDAAITFGFGWLDAVLTSIAKDLLPSECRKALVAGTDAEVQRKGGGGEKPTS